MWEIVKNEPKYSIDILIVSQQPTKMVSGYGFFFVTIDVFVKVKYKIKRVIFQIFFVSLSTMVHVNAKFLTIETLQYSLFYYLDNIQ